jgi:16S rRNA (adenine1518-N6/adenine1519-N6)-dimethyltransferase
MTTSSRRRALGQHFLADAGIAARIVDAVGATSRDLVCEIGAGEGALTRLLGGRAGRVVALEVDRRLHAAFAATAERWPTVEPRLADARTFPYEALREQRPAADGRVLVVGNLPYSASKPILHRLWTARAALEAATCMLQREVAERLVAPPGGKDYGVPSVLWQVWADVALLFTVPPGAFRPAPAVESAVVQALFRRTPRVPIDDPAVFARVVKAGFGQRRKTLANALRTGFPGFGAAGVEARLARAGIDARRRAETLTLEEFARLARFFAAPEAA